MKHSKKTLNLNTKSKYKFPPMGVDPPIVRAFFSKTYSAKKGLAYIMWQPNEKPLLVSFTCNSDNNSLNKNYFEKMLKEHDDIEYIGDVYYRNWSTTNDLLSPAEQQIIKLQKEEG
jgi:hypothetical protein